MSRNSEIDLELQAALSVDPQAEGERKLVPLLESMGFSFPARSAINLRLLAHIFPPSLLRSIVVAALSTPVPDMALNNLERISASASRSDMLSVCTAKKRLVQLLTICGSSPFLTSILCRDPSFFKWLFLNRMIDHKRDEESMLAALRVHTSSSGYQELLPLLRRFKHREILRIATRDLCGLASLEEVTAELSALAAASLQVAYESARRMLVEEHGLPIMETPNGPQEADLAILGMGKLGGRELNFSSDIDIIYIYSSDQGGTHGVPCGDHLFKGKISLHAFFVKLAELITRALSQVTDEGFVFRADLGLRPEGKNGEIAISVRSAEIYYESWGQSWERAAMLKARPVAGSLDLGEHFLQSIAPFIYRRYLDYTLIEDMMAMKLKIDASLTREREGESNIKLGRGG